MTEDQVSPLETFVDGYCDNVALGFGERWKNYKPEIYYNEIGDAIWGLVSRQAMLAIELAGNPGIWTIHTAPIILRCMTDTHITLAWILASPKDRSKDYIRFGLGQEKLFLEYLENEADQIPEGEIDESLDSLIELKRSWLNSQLMEWAIEINVGSWSGKSTREMAKEAGCESLYKFAYVPYSGAAHSMWQHVGLINVIPCENPLHKNHRIPVLLKSKPNPDFLFRSSKYISRTYELLSDKLGIKCDVPLPVDYFVDHHPFREDSADGARNGEPPAEAST